MKRLFSVVFLCVLISGFAFGQKVKYKDLFVLLNARQFDQAEPFLKKYLKDNDDNPNAYLFMGQIYQERSQKSDVLKATEASGTLADSAIFFYDKAYKLITEKELKRNDEYYQAYSRRDARTGEFGVKLSDVQLDIEKRTQNLKDRKQRVSLLKSQFLQVESLYQQSTRQFKNFQSAYNSYRDLLLRSDENTVTDLERLARTYDSVNLLFTAYKATLGLLGKTGYSQAVNAREIADLKTDVSAPIDFFKDELPLFDFRKWAEATAAIIHNDVTPLRKDLIAYDIEINKLADKVKKDSVSVNADLKGIESKLTINPLAKYDPNPMPMEVFRMKIAELRYASVRAENRVLRDSADLIVKINALKQEFNFVQKVDSVSAKLVERNIDDDAANYQHFVTNAYGTTLVLKSLIKATHEYAIVEKNKREAELNKVQASLNWLTVDADSIPLSATPASRYNYRPLVISENQFTSGLKYGADSVATGYFFTITPSRKPDIKVTFPVDAPNFKKRNLPVIKSLTKGDEKGQLFFTLIYSQTKVDNKFPVTLAKIYRTDGLAWSANFKMEEMPSELLLNTETGDVSIKLTSATGESKLVIVDKSGKLVR